MRRPVILLTVIGLLAGSAVCAAPQEDQQIFNNMANEMAECAAYFGILAVAMENSKKPADAKAWREQGEEALESALIVTSEAGLKEETVAARYKMASDDMSKRIDKNTSNISILMADYNDLCVKIMNDPK